MSDVLESGFLVGLPGVNLTESAAAFVIGILPPEHLPAVAVEGLEKGLDSTSLAALAGEPPRSDSRDLRALFIAALRELDLPLPSLLEAAQILKQYYAAQVSGGHLPPRQGASLIVVRLLRGIDSLLPKGAWVGDSFGIARLVGLYYSYDEIAFNDYRSIGAIDQDIVAECARICAQGA